MITPQSTPAEVVAARAEGFDRGWSAAMTYAIRLFWQTECLAIADSFDRSAADCVLKIHTLTTPDNAHAKAIAMWSERAERCRARAAQYREWADGKKSKPLYEVQTRPWLRGDDE